MLFGIVLERVAENRKLQVSQGQCVPFAISAKISKWTTTCRVTEKKKKKKKKLLETSVYCGLTDVARSVCL